MPRASVSIPDLIQCLHILILPILIIIGLFYTVFSEFTAAKFIAASAILLSWLLTFGVGTFLRGLVQYVHNSKKLKVLDQCKGNLLIGWSGGMVLGWVPRLIVYMDSYSLAGIHFMEFLCYLIFVILATISLLWILFVTESKTKSEVVYKKRDKVPWIVLGLNCITLVITVRIGMAYDFEEDRQNIIWTQIGFFGICTACSIEFWQILLGDVRLLDGNSENPVFLVSASEIISSPNAPSPAPNPESVPETIPPETDPRLECKICMGEYSDSRIPRILKECGHTVCEECAGNLLKTSNGQHLFCPFCQKVTLVNGPASLLPKNFTITDMIDEKKKKTIEQILV